MEGYSEEEGYYIEYRHAPTVKPLITEAIPKRDTILIIYCISNSDSQMVLNFRAVESLLETFPLWKNSKHW